MKRIKLKNGPAPAPSPLPTTPAGPTIIRTKLKGKIPRRPRGVGYDSEASDRENDPVITEAIVLRMAPGPDCEYLRDAVAKGNFGKISDGGADVRLRFVRSDDRSDRSDGRRAAISIRGNHYAAILVDLPCIVEAMKSWFPKNGWMKSADICQMLMVLGPIKQLEEAATYEVPTKFKGELDAKTWQWAHGLTPPMHWVRKRRFRKRISVRTVMEVEEQVEDLLRRDQECIGEPKIEIIDRGARGSEAASEDEYGEDEDAEGDFDNQDQHEQMPMETIEGANGAAPDDEEDQTALAEFFEQGMMATDDAEPTTTQTLTSAGPSFDSPSQLETQSTPPSLAATPSAVATPTAATAVDTSSAADDEEEQESDEDDDQDEDQAERQQEMQKLKEEVEDLESAIKSEHEKLAALTNVMLRQRLQNKIRGLQGDLELKIKAMEGDGEG